MLVDRELVLLFERIRTNDCVAISRELGAVDVAIGDGVAVLMGPGFYVNRAFGLGLEGPVGHDHLRELERVSAEVGVPAAIEANPWADQSLFEIAAERGYRATSTTSALAMQLEHFTPSQTTSDLAIRSVEADLSPWQDAASRGFSYTSREQRRVSDLFVEAVSRVPEIELLVASTDERVVAASSLAIREGVAYLGGMSTDPTARRRGVQSAMIDHRLNVASHVGCEVAISSARPGSGSERNLLRAGFHVLLTHVNLVRPDEVT